MATPFVVPKLSLPTDSNEFDCDNSSGARPSYPTGSCRLSCANWCSACEHHVQTEYPGRKSSPEVIKLNGCNAEFHRTTDGENVNVQRHPCPFGDYKKVSPNKNQTFESRLDNQSPAPETSGSRNWLASCAGGVQEKYLREVEALRGKLKEIRDNLPISLGESLDKNNFNLLCSSIPKSVIPTGCPITTVKSVSGECNDSALRDRKRSGTPNHLPVQRTAQLSGSELNLNAVAASSKRPRDGSPEIKESDQTGTTKEKFTLFNNCKPMLKEAYSSLSLESEDNIESLEEEEDESDDDFPSEDYSKVVDKTFLPASVSPSYTVGDTLGKISLNDVNLTYAQSINPDIHPSIRPSLFSYVPPYIRFSTHDVKVDLPLPIPLQRVLKWKLTTITPVVVRKTVMNSGFKLVRKSPEWGGTWGKHMKSVCFKTLKTNQKLNHFPGTFQIGRKDRLWKNLYHLMTKFGKKEFGFIPRTYVMPQDNKLLRAAWEKSGGKAKWIIKPPASARGSGIKVIHKWTQIPKKVPLIVQKYISNPYLINGSKFDLRLYVLVTSFNPLRIYLYDNGLVRFASVKYSDDMNTLADRYMHLTNYSINKLSTQYTQNEDAEACQGHKWTVKTLWSYLEGSVNVEALWKSLTELVIKTMIAGESAISQLMWANLPSRYCSYELFGVDVLLDEYLKPWLLEVNISPSLHSASPLDLAVKGPMVQNIMNLAGYHIPNKLSSPQEAEVSEKLGLQGSELVYDNRLYVMGLSPEEKSKHNYFIHVYDRSAYLDSILSDLTPDDVRHLIQYEDELTQIGRFEKIFPTPHTHHYQQFFDTQRYYNMLFDAWETKYHKNRSAGIQLLESLCRQKIHLDISNIEVRKSLVCASDSSLISTLSTEEGELEKGPVTLKTRDSSSTTDDSTDKKQDDLLLNGNVTEVAGGE